MLKRILIIVAGVALLGIIAVAVLVKGSIWVMGKVASEAQVQRATADLSSLESALHMYQIQGGSYPSQAQGLNSLVERPTTSPAPTRWAQLMPSVPVDPWNHEYRYEVRQTGAKTERMLRSIGPDEKDPADDIERIMQPRPEA